MHGNLKNWMVNEGSSVIILNVVLLAQLAYFIASFIQIQRDPSISIIRSILGYGLPIARAAGNVLNMLAGLLLLTVCRNLISLFRQTFLNRYIPFDNSIDLHVAMSYSIILWSIVHVTAHYFNFLYLSSIADPNLLSLTSGPGATGQVINVALFLMATSAISKQIRRLKFELFFYSHYLYLIFYGASLMHGSFCFIKADPKPGVDRCRGGAHFWMWFLAPFLIHSVERISREIRGRFETTLTKIIEHPSKVVEVQFMKKSFRYISGQYLFLCCPEISLLEWHPFTITSSPHEDFISIHISVVGDWTTRFAKRVGWADESVIQLPYIMVDGGFGSASEDVFNYQTIMLIGAGIGVVI